MTLPLRGEFRWAGAASPTLEGLTEGALSLHVYGLLTWGRAGEGVAWTWYELLEGLSSNWNRLLFEGPPGAAGKPAGGPVARTALLASYRARVDLGDGTPEWMEAADDQLYDWEQAHELSRFLPGIALEEVSVYAVAEGVEFATRHTSFIADHADADAALSAIGEQVAARLSLCVEPAAAAIVAAWRGRRAQAADAWAALATGMPVGVLEHARGPMGVAEAWGDADGRMARTIFLQAAFACRAIGRFSMAAVFAAVRDLAPAGAWNEVVDDLAERLRTASGWYVEAVAATMAREVRGMAGLGSIAPASPVRMALDFGVHVVEIELDEAGFAGVAVHRPGFSPLLLLNSRGSGARDDADRRHAVAFGLGRLLAAALTGATEAIDISPRASDRARDRFAAELLLPVAAIAEAISGLRVAGVIATTSEAYGVDATIASRQLLASGLFASAHPVDQAAARASGEREEPRQGPGTARLRVA